MENISNEPKALNILADFALANTIFSAYSLGLFEPFKNGNPTNVIDIDDLKQKNNWNIRILIGLAEHLSHRKVFKRVEGEVNKYSLGELGQHIVLDKWFSYIVYYVGGYGNVLLNSQKIARNELVYGKTIQRDIDWVAIGTELMSLTPHHKSYSAVLETCRRDTSQNVLDIGCGTAKFLIELTKVSNCKMGVGIDISEQACKLAEQVASENSQNCDIDILVGDFLTSIRMLKERYSEFDIVTAMMIIHEYLYEGEDKLIEVLKGIGELLSSKGSFILLDKATDALKNSPLYFTEFKLAHDLTNQDLCSKSKWEELLGEAGLKIKKEIILPFHTGSILFECVKK